jgi:polyisoprenoid-binding protein YceI
MTSAQPRNPVRDTALILATCALSAAAGCSRPAPQHAASAAPAVPAEAVAPSTAPAGLYRVDKPHTSVNFRISHMGISHFTARFTRIGGTLKFDPAHPEAMVADITVDPASIQTNYPDPKYDFDGQLRGAQLLDTAKYPQITFRSTKVERTGPRTARVTGDFTFHGVTRPLVLETTFNGGYAPNSMDPGGARIGFSAHTAFNRSDFGMGYGVPPKGTTMGVGDKVDIAIEAEFTSK